MVCLVKFSQKYNLVPTWHVLNVLFPGKMTLVLLILQCTVQYGSDSYVCYIGKQEIELRGVDPESIAVGPIG